MSSRLLVFLSGFFAGLLFGRRLLGRTRLGFARGRAAGFIRRFRRPLRLAPRLFRRLRSGKALAVEGDLGYAHRRERLPVSGKLLVLLFALVVKYQYLIAAPFAQDAPGDARLRLRPANLAIGTGDHQHFAEFHVAVLRRWEFLHPDDVARRDAILLAPGATDCVHGCLSHRRVTSSADGHGPDLICACCVPRRAAAHLAAKTVTPAGPRAGPKYRQTI